MKRRQLIDHLLLLIVWLCISSTNATTTDILGHDSEWWLQRVHLDEDFLFDGSHSDFAQQFYRRFLEGDTASSMDNQLTIPTAVQVRIASDSIRFADLSPLLQRALLWDMGIVRAGDLSFVQVYTRCGLRMGELALSQAIFEAIGCVAQPCSTPNGELFYQSLYCNGYQVGNASRCATTKGKTPVHSSMWSNGGDDWVLPETEIGKHEWSEGSNKYTIYGIHLADDPNAYGRCVAPSMTVPCIAYELLSSQEQDQWCEPIPSRLVTQWIQVESEILIQARQEKSTTQSSRMRKYYYLVGSITLAVAVLAVVVWWWRRFRRRQRIEDDERERRKRELTSGTASEDGGEAAGGVSYFFTDDSVDEKSSRRRTGIGRDPQATAVLGASGNGVSKPIEPPIELAFVDDSFQHHAYEGDDDATGTRRAPYSPMLYCSRHATTAQGKMVSGQDTNGARERRGVAFASHVSICSRPTSVLTTTSVSSGFISSSEASQPSFASTSSSTKASSAPPLRRHKAPLTALLHDPLVMSKRVPFIDVSISRRLSKGAYGEVWIGRMRDQLVAVKRLLPERRTDLQDLDIFIAEIRLMAQFTHRNVLSLIGVAWNAPENLCIMMEFADRGDLQQLLKAHTPQQLPWTRKISSLTSSSSSFLSASQRTQKKTQIAIDIATGLEYLHTLIPSVVHRDLKSNNVLLSDEFVAKLCDFGVSRVNEGIETMTCGVGTACWTAPEVLVGDKYTETADVYSFGVVLTELDTHLLPFHDAVDEATGGRMEMMRIMHLVCLGELAPSLSEQCPQKIRELATDCLKFEPSERPTPQQIIQRLTRFLRDNGGVESVAREDLNSGRKRNRNSSDGSAFSVHDGDDDAANGEGMLISTRRRGALALEAATWALEDRRDAVRVKQSGSTRHELKSENARRGPVCL